MADVAARAQLAQLAKRRRTNRTILISIGAVLGLFLIVGITGRALDRDERTSGPIAAAADRPAALVEVPAAAPTGSPATEEPEPPAPAAPPQVFNGSGDDVVDLTPISAGVLQFDCSGCRRNVVVKSLGGDYPDLLVNEIGAYTGNRLITRETSRIQISATGSWTLTVGGLDLARRVDGAVAAEGTGDDVLLYRAAPDTVRLTHDGERNFVVKAIATTSSFPDLMVNEIGSYEGTVPFDDAGEATVVEVTADGGWSIVPT